jgi:integrase
VLDAAKAQGLRFGENPARWRGHLDQLLPKRHRLTRGHHAAMAYADVPAFMSDLRAREAVAARALEFLILTAARSGEVLGMRWQEMDLHVCHSNPPRNSASSYLHGRREVPTIHPRTWGSQMAVERNVR